MQASHVDFTLLFRRLGELASEVAEADLAVSDAPLRDLFIDRAAFDEWALRYRARLRSRKQRRRRPAAPP
jgi:uncharacterized protein YdiU (UPF0061 family)